MDVPESAMEGDHYVVIEGGAGVAGDGIVVVTMPGGEQVSLVLSQADVADATEAVREFFTAWCGEQFGAEYGLRTNDNGFAIDAIERPMAHPGDYDGEGACEFPDSFGGPPPPGYLAVL